MSEEVPLATALQQVIRSASPEARAVVAEALRLERANQHYRRPPNIVNEIAQCVVNAVPEQEGQL